MIIVTGQPRCGTSMMCHCIHLAGVPKAFTEGIRPSKDIFRNPYGFYEGNWNGEDGVVKSFSPTPIERIKKSGLNPKAILMKRKPEATIKSWDEVMRKIGDKKRHKPIKEPTIEQRLNGIEKRHNMALSWLDGIDYVEVDYDTFVTDPEQYREKFINLFPELDYNIIISGIDGDLYINR